MIYPTQDPNQPPQYPPPPPAYAPAYAGGIPGPGEPFDGASGPDELRRPLYGASFGQAVKRFFKNYANFKGRASRSEYWWAMLFLFLLQIVPGVLYLIGVVTVVGTAAVNTTVDDAGNVTTAPGTAAAAGGGVAILAIGVILLIAGAGSMITRLNEGLGPTNITSYVPWGLWVGFYDYMVWLEVGSLMVIGLATLIPSISIAWRRLHDANLAGPFWFLSLTSIGSIIVLVFTVLPPKPEGRRFDVS